MVRNEFQSETFTREVSEWNRFRFNPYISESFRSITNECEICFRCLESFEVKIRMIPSNYDSFFFSPNLYLKFIPNDSAPLGTQSSFRLNPFNGANSFQMISCQPLQEKTIQKYSENHYLKLLKTIESIHQC